MRSAALLVSLAPAVYTTAAGAGEPPLAAAQSPSVASPPVDGGLRSELARQAAELRELKLWRDTQTPAIASSLFRFSGFFQVDWVIHNQLSQDEINGASQPLNQD